MGEAEGSFPRGAVERGRTGVAIRRARRAALFLVLALMSVLSAVGALPAPALAARGHEFGGAFGWGVLNGASELQRCSGEPPLKPPVCEPSGIAGDGPGQFRQPGAIAINEATGTIYVVDKANDRVEIFNASGRKFEGEFNGSGWRASEGMGAGGGGVGGEASLASAEAATGRLDEPEGIAVDNSCVQLHLSEADCKKEDPSNGDVYVVDTTGHKGGTYEEERQVIDKFSPTGEYLGQIARDPNGQQFSQEGFQELYGVAVDAHGEAWVEGHNFSRPLDGAANYTSAVRNAWIGFRSTENERSAVAAPGFAVDAEDNLYVHNTFFGGGDRLAKFSTKEEQSGEAKLLSPELDEEAPTGVAVEASSGDVYISHAGNVHRLDASGVSLEHPLGTSHERLEAPSGTPNFSGVAISPQALTVYAAESATARIDVFSPEGPNVPKVIEGSESVAQVSANGASFSAEVNPRSEEDEAATSYAFRYGPCPSRAACGESPYPQSIPEPEGTLAPNYEPDEISADPQDLSPHTVYHMRVFAHNAHGEGHGEEVIFTTQGAGSQVLPDRRQWELVSPPEKHGAAILAQGIGAIQAAVSGDAITYLADAPSEANPPGFSGIVQILSRRGPTSWQSQDISTPHEVPAGVGVSASNEYTFFSEDLASAIVQPFGPFTQATSPQASEQTLYERSDFPPGDPSNPCTSSCYHPLVSGCPGAGEPCAAPIEPVANVPEGTKFGIEPGGPFFLDASPDGSHVLLTAKAPLVEGAPEESVYEWSAGKLSLVSMLPGEKAAPRLARPAPGYFSESGGVRIARHAISSDGRLVVFSAAELDASKEHRIGEHLYLRDMARQETIKLDVPEAGCGICKAGSLPIFQTASADDSRIFFTDSQPLTQSSGTSDLYECQIEEPEEGALSCKLSDLTPGGDALGLVAGASEDGSAIYFTANGKLTTQLSPGKEAAVAGDCGGKTETGKPESETAPQSCNLYERVGGQTKLVAVLSGADFPDWSLREGQTGGLRALTGRVSPDGRYLAFSSRRALSGYDNRDEASGKPDQEIFLYDSSANGGQGSLICASCNPSGGRPHGVLYERINTEEGGLAGGSGIWPNSAWIAASAPSWSAINVNQGFALQQARYLSDAGRLFFNSPDALVPNDTNGTEDVYEYEPLGVGDCEEVKATFVSSAGGCVALISSGTAKEESAFLDASESGDDAFFLTGQRLWPNEDLDSSLDVYDAHVCTDSPCLSEPSPPPAACEGDACQSPGQPPQIQTPGSLTYQGPGNPTPPVAPPPKHKSAAELKAEKLRRALTACHKQKKERKRAACEAKARKLYGAQKAGTKAKKQARSKKR